MRSVLAVLSLTLVVAVARAETTPPPLTHTTPLTPTGDVLPRGHVQRIQSLTAFHHQLAVGLGGGVELGLASPLLPVPIMGGDVQLRVALLPAHHRAAVVLGAALTAEWIDGFDAWTGVTATLAWRQPRWSGHATVRLATHAGDDDRLGLANLGATRRVGETGLLYVELVEGSWQRPSMCARYHGGQRPCAERDAAQTLWIGGWWQARSMRAGISAAVLHVAGQTLPVLPLLSFAWDRDL